MKSLEDPKPFTVGNSCLALFNFLIFRSPAGAQEETKWIYDTAKNKNKGIGTKRGAVQALRKAVFTRSPLRMCATR